MKIYFCKFLIFSFSRFLIKMRLRIFIVQSLKNYNLMKGLSISIEKFGKIKYLV